MSQYDKLWHHGIKGQKWGVRRGPPYPIEDRTLHKGQKLNSVSFFKDSETYRSIPRWMYTYRPDDEWDNKVYKGPFLLYKREVTGGQYVVFEHQYEVVKDLRMPTSKERIDEFVKLYSDSKSMVVKDLAEVQKRLRQHKIGTEESQKVNLKRLKTDNEFKAAYEVFNHAMENMSRYASTRRYAEMMSQKYDAMVDDNNQGVYNRAHDPIIIFRTNEALKSIGKARMVDLNEINDNYWAVRNELVKSGERVKL